MTAFVNRLLLRFVWAIASVCAPAGVLAQAIAEQVGLVLAVAGDVVVEGRAGGSSVPAYSVLLAGTSLRLGQDATATLVHHKEGVTYTVKGPAVVGVLAQRLTVEPAAAVVSKTTGTSPVEREARGGAAVRGDRPDLRAGGENLDTSRSGLEAASKSGPVQAPMPADDGGSIVLTIIAWVAAIGILLFVLWRLPFKYGIALAALVLVAGSLYYVSRPSDSVELMKALESAKSSNEMLMQARTDNERAARALEEARQAERQARASGDAARQAELANRTRQLEAELQQQAMLVAQREAEAKRMVEAALASAKRAKASEAAKSEAGKKAAAEKSASEKAALDAAAQQKAAADRAAAERAASEKAAQEKSATASASAKAPELTAKSAEAAKPKKVVPLSAESPVLPEQSEVPSLSLYEQGKAAEAAGNIKAAVRLYVRAVRAGDYRAAVALGDIFADGRGDVAKDYGESLKYYALAEKHGIKFERSTGRGR